MAKAASIQYDEHGNPLVPQGIYQIKRKKIFGFGYHYGVFLNNIFPLGPIVVDLDNEEQIKVRYFLEWLHGKDKWWLVGYCPAEELQNALQRLAYSVQVHDGYKLLTNNCEHFANWVVNGQPRSFQIEKGMQHVRRIAQIALVQLVRQLPRYL